MNTINNLLLLVAAGYDEIGFDKALSVVASLIFIGTFILQFFSIYRHGGRDAVVSMLTWVLVACLCAAMAGYYWQQQRDFFQVVLLLILTGGALSCFLISIFARNAIEDEVERLKAESGQETNREDQIEQAAAAMREKLAIARKRKEA